MAMTAVCLGWMHPRTAMAQPVRVPTVARGPGRDSLDRGLALLRQQRWVEAMPHLEESVRLEPTPLGWFNLGLAYRGAGRFSAAINAFERYLVAPESDAPPARLSALRAELPNLLRSVARMQVTVAPASATIRLDGRTALMTGGELRLDPGTHSLEFDAPGHEPVRREVNLQAGATTMLDLQLHPLAVAATIPQPSVIPVAPSVVAPIAEATGRLVVEPSVPSALVSVDGIPRGQGPLTLELTAGDHRVDVRAADYQPWSRGALVHAGSTLRLTPTLLGAPSGPRGWVLPVAIAGGTVLVTAVVVGAVILTRGMASPSRGSWDTVRE